MESIHNCVPEISIPFTDCITVIHTATSTVYYGGSTTQSKTYTVPDTIDRAQFICIEVARGNSSQSISCKVNDVSVPQITNYSADYTKYGYYTQEVKAGDVIVASATGTGTTSANSQNTNSATLFMVLVHKKLQE